MTEFSPEFIAGQRKLLRNVNHPLPWSGAGRPPVIVTNPQGPDHEIVFWGHDANKDSEPDNWGDIWYTQAAANHYPDALAEIERQTARAEAAERERDALRDRLRWIPVEERLPEDNEWVLAADRCWRGHPYREWLYHHALRDLFVYEFSHWMPLPEPPEGGER